jgi:Fic family protein
MKQYIHLRHKWPEFRWNSEILLPLLGKTRIAQGILIGKMGTVSRHTGTHLPGLILSDRNVDGMVDMMFDATHNFKDKLSKKRLISWHTGLFPVTDSRNQKITAGGWRNDSNGPLKIVSVVMGREKVHFEAPEAYMLETEMKLFLKWFNQDQGLDPVIKAGLAHLWFVTIHPFDDGNGRIARAITDMQLARSENNPERYYSISAQIRAEQDAYYEILEKTQKGNLDVTDWLIWFLECMMNSLSSSEETLATVIQKSNFWKMHSATVLNERQILMINKLLEGFTGKLTSSEWAKIAKCSPDTALRDIQDLTVKGILKKESAGGRSTNYELLFSPLLQERGQG